MDADRADRTRALRRVLGVALLLGAGFLAREAGAPAARWQFERQPAFRAASFESALGQGALLALFGGFRGVMADFAWVRAYVHGTRRDRASFEVCARLSLTLAPDSFLFWRDYANAVAYDEPWWETDAHEDARRRRLPENERARIFRDAALRGLDALAQGIVHCPQREAEFRELAALLWLNKLGDTAKGAEQLRLAAECARPSWWASTAYPVILSRDLGKRDAAAAWLRGRIAKIRAGTDPDPLRLLADFEEILRSLEKPPAARNSRREQSREAHGGVPTRR
jgi:hypothetical protein